MGFNSAFKGLTDWFCVTEVESIYTARWRAFTARYALNPYIKQTRLVFKMLDRLRCFSITDRQEILIFKAP
jgi:hypothetical protein